MASNTWVPAFMQGMGAYLSNPNVAGMYGMWDSPTPGLHSNGTVTPGEGGVDLDAPIGTPVYAIADGNIVGAGYWNDANHGVITTRINVPGAGSQDLYYQHITLDPSIKQCIGNCSQSVKKGQLIGTVGQFGETEMGFNAQWGGIWGTNHPGPWVVDPRPMLAALMTGNPGVVSATPWQGTSNGTDSTGNSATNNAVIAQGAASIGTRAGLFIVALILVGFGVYVLFQKQIEAGAGQLAHGAKKAVEVAAI